MTLPQIVQATSQAMASEKLTIKRLKLMVLAFFVCLFIPLSVIIYYVFQQFENEMDFQYQYNSVNTLTQLNKKLDQRVKIERKRPFTHYNFYQYVENPLTNVVSKTISPLANSANYPENVGLIGYFQIDANGALASPLLPAQTKSQLQQASTNLQWPEVERRIAIKEKLRQILLANDFNVQQQDEHELSPTEDALPLVKSHHYQSAKVEFFQVHVGKNGKLIIFRNVWVNQQYYIQGFIVERDAYLQQLIYEFFEQVNFETDVQIRLKLIHTDNGVLQYLKYAKDENGQANLTILAEPDPKLEQQYIFQGYFIAPFQKLQLKFTTSAYPLGTASEFVLLFLIILILIILASGVGFYWVGKKQMALTEQRMNFVSSVSHELRTPLTSILMYAEILKSGMINSAETQQEYHEFIYEESGRLARLINNILQLSSLNNQQRSINTSYVNLAIVSDTIRSKTSSLTEKHHFELAINIDKQLSADAAMLIDLDAFVQIVINLVDNAIKFTNSANIVDESRRKIDVNFSYKSKHSDKLLFSVRDYGPGISATAQDKIFQLFYREGSEMIRTTPGTGIGLALVNELVIAQGGKISVQSKKPGVAFDMVFVGKNLRAAN